GVRVNRRARIAQARLENALRAIQPEIHLERPRGTIGRQRELETARQPVYEQARRGAGGARLWRPVSPTVSGDVVGVLLHRAGADFGEVADLLDHAGLVIEAVR